MYNRAQEKRFSHLIIIASILLSPLSAMGQSAAAGTGPYDQFSEDPTRLSFDTPMPVYPSYSTPTSTSNSLEKFIPTSIILEHYGQQNVKRHDSHMSCTNLYVAAPILRPENTSLGKWNIDMKVNARITWFDSDGASFLGERNLYTVGLQTSAIRSIAQGKQFILGLAPQISSDFDLISHDIFYFGAYAAYAQTVNDRLKYTVGLSYMPRYYENSILPLFAINWKVSNNYELRMEAARLSLINVSRDNFQWGPFLQFNTSVWTVRHDATTKQMRQSSVVLGLASQYGMGDKKSTSYHILADIGVTVDNQIKIQTSNGDRTLEKFETSPGLYARLGFEIRF